MNGFKKGPKKIKERSKKGQRKVLNKTEIVQKR